jgi:hypothetical protein
VGVAVSAVTYLVGDVFEVLATLEPASVDLVLTSPPFLALRSYLPADHPDKGKEIGSEPTPAAFVDRLLDVVEALDRVLAPHGSLVIELGDTYSGSGGSGGDWLDSPGTTLARVKGGSDGGPTKRDLSADWLLPKSLALVPESFRWALAYGRNPFNGRPTPSWRVRNVIRWCRPNPPVGALGDKFRPATTDLVVACHSAQRYFDLDAVRTAHVNPRPQETNGAKNAHRLDGDGHGFTERTVNPGGAPPLDWWEIPTEPYPGAHYATWPSALCVVPIKAMCPERVCTVCGQPSRRMVGDTLTYAAIKGNWKWDGENKSRKANPTNLMTQGGADHVTLGWTDCGHDAWRPGMVLDPFAGSGTTLAVAHGHGRSAIGIDLDERNRDLALDRVGMWLDEPVRPVVDVQMELAL